MAAMEAQAAQGTRGAPGGGLGALAGACGGLLAGGIGWRWLRRGEVRPAAALPRAEQSGAQRWGSMAAAALLLGRTRSAAKAEKSRAAWCWQGRRSRG